MIKKCDKAYKEEWAVEIMYGTKSYCDYVQYKSALSEAARVFPACALGSENRFWPKPENR